MRLPFGTLASRRTLLACQTVLNEYGMRGDKHEMAAKNAAIRGAKEMLITSILGETE